MATIINIYIGKKTDVSYTRYYGFDKGHNSCHAETYSEFYLDQEVELSIIELFVFSKFFISKGEDFREGDGTPDITIDVEPIYIDLLDTLNRLSSVHVFKKGSLNECKFKVTLPSPPYSGYLDKCVSSDESIDAQIISLQNEMIELKRSIEPQLSALQAKRNDLIIEQLFSKLIHLSNTGIIDPYAKIPIEIYGKYADYFNLSPSNELYKPRISFGPSPIQLALSLGNSKAVAEFYQYGREDNLGDLAPKLLDAGIETQEIIDSCEPFAIFKALSNNNINILSKCNHLKEIIIEICVLDSMFGNNWGLIMWFERKKWYNYFSKTRNIKDLVDVRFWVFDCLDNVNRDLIKYLEQKGIIYSSFDNSPANAEESIEKERTFSQNERLKKSGWSFSIVLENEYRIDSHYSQYCGIIYQMKTLDGITYGTRDIKCSSFLRQGTKISACIVSQYDLKNKDNSAYRMTSLIGKPR